MHRDYCHEAEERIWELLDQRDVLTEDEIQKILKECEPFEIVDILEGLEKLQIKKKEETND